MITLPLAEFIELLGGEDKALEMAGALDVIDAARKRAIQEAEPYLSARYGDLEIADPALNDKLVEAFPWHLAVHTSAVMSEQTILLHDQALAFYRQITRHQITLQVAEPQDPVAARSEAPAAVTPARHRPVQGGGFDGALDTYSQQRSRLTGQVLDNWRRHRGS